MHSYIAHFWREILCGNLRNTTSSLQQNEGTNNILFISVKGKKLISHNSSFICWFEEEPTSLEETHKRRLPLYNKWWNREFTLEKEWIRFALASQGNNSCISFFMTKKALLYMCVLQFSGNKLSVNCFSHSCGGNWFRLAVDIWSNNSLWLSKFLSHSYLDLRLNGELLYILTSTLGRFFVNDIESFHDTQSMT